MATAEVLDSVIEEHGWEGVLRALILIAGRDNFEVMGSELSRACLT
jgi:hypothetical protein